MIEIASFSFLSEKRYIRTVTNIAAITCTKIGIEFVEPQELSAYKLLFTSNLGFSIELPVFFVQHLDRKPKMKSYKTYMYIGRKLVLDCLTLNITNGFILLIFWVSGIVRMWEKIKCRALFSSDKNIYFEKED